MESGLSILVADNFSITRLGTKEYLSSKGHTIIGEASNWGETLKSMITINPDVIIMEYLLPGISQFFFRWVAC